MDSIKQISELSPDSFYHVKLSPPYSAETVRSVAEALRSNKIKALITGADVEIQTFAELLEDLPQEKKDEILAILSGKPKFTIDEPLRKCKLEVSWDDAPKLGGNEVNPIDHEQTK